MRELYYSFVKIFKTITNKKIKICFRAKVTKRSSFEGYNKIEHHSFFDGEIGLGSYIGEYSSISGKIGRFCSIGGHVTVLSTTHPINDFVSTCPSFYSIKKQNGLSFVKKNLFTEVKLVKDTPFPVIIGNDVYIGYGVTLIAPITIGNGAVIAAGSIVTKNIEPYSVVGGNPARLIRYRFEAETINKLEAMNWWNNDIDWLKEKAPMFSNINDFTSNIHL